MCMKNSRHVRLNITLPAKTVEMLETVAEKGSRSTFIDLAIKNQIRETRKKELRKQLKAGAIANAERDLAMVRESDLIQDETWPDY
jgi:CopG family transcriptional regulator/antitoxin EndoAI